jgi:hypothetical protein
MRAYLAERENGGYCDSTVPAVLGEMSADIAAREYALGLVTNDELVTLFTDSCRLDYRRRATRNLHDICADWLGNALRRRNATWSRKKAAPLRGSSAQKTTTTERIASMTRSDRR